MSVPLHKIHPDDLWKGRLVVWLHVPRGGYGFAIPVDAEVLTRTKARVRIKVTTGKGIVKTVSVRPESLRSRSAPDCAIVMWATAPMLDAAFDVMKAWGFKFKTAGAWGKQSKTGTKLAFGTGYVLRSAAEFFLVGTIGKPAIRSRSERNLILAPVREHSRKPDAMHEIVERLFDGPYCELFARRA